MTGVESVFSHELFFHLCLNVYNEAIYKKVSSSEKKVKENGSFNLFWSF